MSERREWEELLPDYLNGHLPEEQIRRLEHALAEDAGLRDEYRFLQQLQAVLQERSEATPGRMGWHRLRRSLEAERRPASSARTVGLRGWWRPAAALAAATVIAVQAVMLLQVYRAPAGAIVPLSAESRAQIQLRFQPDATAAQIHALLRTEHLEIVAGPGAAGVYHLRTRGRADLPALVRRLAARDDIVAFVTRE